MGHPMLMSMPSTSFSTRLAAFSAVSGFELPSCTMSFCFYSFFVLNARVPPLGETKSIVPRRGLNMRTVFMSLRSIISSEKMWSASYFRARRRKGRVPILTMGARRSVLDGIMASSLSSSFYCILFNSLKSSFRRAASVVILRQLEQPRFGYDYDILMMKQGPKDPNE